MKRCSTGLYDGEEEGMHTVCGRGVRARNLAGGFKPLYHNVNARRNRLGIILKEEYVKSLLEVKSVGQTDGYEAGS